LLSTVFVNDVKKQLKLVAKIAKNVSIAAVLKTLFGAPKSKGNIILTLRK